MSALDEEINDLDAVILQMAGQVEENLTYASGVYLDFDPRMDYQPVEDYKVNAFERQVEAKCLAMMLKERLFASDLRKVTGIMSMVQDLERLGDHAEDLLQFSLKLRNSAKDNSDIAALTAFVIKMVDDGIESYIARDEKLAREVIGRDDHVDQEYAAIVERLIADCQQGKVTSKFAIYTTLVVKYLERIADHATNIAEWTVYILTGYYKDAQLV
jgi:phosphate transport system protein